MKGRVILTLCVIALLISGVIAASAENKTAENVTVDNKTAENKTVDSSNAVDDKKEETKEKKEVETPETGDNTGDTVIKSAEISSKSVSAQTVIVVEALKGQAVTDLIIHVPTDVTMVKKIQVKAYYADGTSKFSRNFFDSPVVNGIISLQLNDLQRGEKVDFRIQTDRYGWLEGSATVLNRPDLVISSADAVGKIVVSDTLSVNVSILEKNGDLGSVASVSLLNGESVLDTRSVSIGAGGMTRALLSTVIRTSGQYNLSIRITNSVPAEYDETNNEKSFVVSAVAPDLTVSNITAPTNVTVGQGFEVLATISELNGETGANATVTLLEGSSVLDTKTLTVNAGTTGTVSLAGTLNTAGIHTLTVRIKDSVPQDSDSSNNEQSFPITVVSSDLAVSNVSAPAVVAVGQGFEVLAEIKELSGNAGAIATVSLLENGTVLDNRTVDIGPGSTGTVSLNGTLATVGGHNLLVRITDSVPQDADLSNNELGFTVFAKKAPETMSYASKYYYQNESSNNSHYITAPGLVDNSEELVFEEKETISFTSSSSRALSFPIDRVYINITNEAGTGTVYEERNVTSANGTNTFTKYYPETNAVLTLSVGSNGVTLNIERNASNSTKQSKGYLYWWFKSAQVWNKTTNSGTGKFLGARESMQVQVEVEDGLTFMGGSTITGISGKSYTGGWSDNTEGIFVQKKSTGVYSGNDAGITVIG